jgi:hypothetical protein
MDELPSPGWQAIDDAMAKLYGNAIPHHVGYVPPAALSHNLQGCSAYLADDHWHYVTYGLSELYVARPEADLATSGWGFELTFRLVRGDETSPPGWPFTMLNRLANLVNEGTLTVPPPGTRISIGEAITGHPNVPDAPPTDLATFAVAVDPQLGEIDTPNGRVAFLLLVGVNEAEYSRMVVSGTQQVLDILAADNPLLVTELSRR